jgi:hypothetical protein
MGCHSHLGANPDEHKDWVISRLGEARYAALIEKAREIPRLRKADLEAIYSHYKAKLEALEKQAA